MTKTKKIIVSAAAALTLAIGATTCALILNTRNTAVADNETQLVSELKVGKYYLENGTDEEYIEVYPDQTMCMFGYTMPADATEVQKESMKTFIERRYYELAEVVPHIGLGETPSADNQYKVGYGYTSQNRIRFSTMDGKTLFYVYRAE